MRRARGVGARARALDGDHGHGRGRGRVGGGGELQHVRSAVPLASPTLGRWRTSGPRRRGAAPSWTPSRWFFGLYDQSLFTTYQLHLPLGILFLHFILLHQADDATTQLFV